MVVLVVLAVLLAVGAPSFTTLIRDNRLVSSVYDLRGALGTARSEALAQRAFVTVCPSNDGASCSGSWTDGYIAFVDFDGDGTIDTGGTGPDDNLVLANVSGFDAIAITLAATDASGRLRFDPQGTALNNNGTFTFCDERGVSEARALFLSNAGSARSLEDSNDDGIVNLPAAEGGGNVSCP
ncbi:Type IV fimbrial biogenesis protein FimT [Pseudohaliea rubra DSM 19751]|uniref:Type II secretion system protein H n=2 Tax=Pseudohaliea TaxID=1341120 RepID=A0A095WYN7_9GAMM|nr:Type IV fimbrial biogenesis protein FimT [Pseudohaliea rubra DSM 19751]